jgi:hypothetical protein
MKTGTMLFIGLLKEWAHQTNRDGPSSMSFQMQSPVDRANAQILSSFDLASVAGEQFAAAKKPVLYETTFLT